MEKNIYSGLTRVLALVALVFSSISTVFGGSVAAWGAGTKITSPADGLYNYGQSIPPAGTTNAAEIAAGGLQSLALLAGGKLQGWGDDGFHETNYFSLNSTNFIAVTCGVYFSAALRSDGTVAASGDDFLVK